LSRFDSAKTDRMQMRKEAVPMAKFRIAVVIALVLLAQALVAERLWAAGTADRIEVPISQIRLTDGTIRYWVPVMVGGRGPIQAMLDTGSVGLRIFADALSPADYQDTGTEGVVRYGSGVELRGTVARAVVKIGQAPTREPVPIQIVRSVGCTEQQPGCPAARVSPEEYRIGGDGLPRQGFKAILGLSLRSVEMLAATVNPLDFVGDQAWIVILPLPGTDAPGTLIINPSAAERAGFSLTPFVITMPPNRFSICIGQASAGSCPPVQVDSGAVAGLPPFYSFAVLYDARSNVIGVKPRANSTQ
jgi:hypothetical protein